MDENIQPVKKSFFARNMWWIVVLVVILLIGGWMISLYNGFVRQNVQIDGQWAQVENQLQRRFDLIPNLEASVKGAFKQEQDVFGAIATARTQYAGAKTIDEKAAAAGQVESAIGRLLVVMENYPQLQSVSTVKDLMTQLEGTENRISVERMKFNNDVKTLNAQVKVFPSSIVAAIFGVKERAYFEVPTENQVAPKVDFTN
jgi:LemA protein